MKNIFFFLIFTLFVTSSLVAQEVHPLTPGGDYICLTYPDGTAVVGLGTAENYTVVDKDDVQKASAPRVKQAKSQLARLIELKIELQSGDSLPKQDMVRVLKSFAKFVRGGKVDPNAPDERIPASREEQLQKVKELIKNLQLIDQTAKYQVKAVELCYEHKPIIPPGNLAVEIVATTQGLAAVLWGKSGTTGPFFDGSNYCGRGDDGKLAIYHFLKDPCAPAQFSCYRKGMVGIYLGGVGTDHPLSQDDIAYWVSYLRDHITSPSYEIKLQTADKKYNLTPCNEILF